MKNIWIAALLTVMLIGVVGCNGLDAFYPEKNGLAKYFEWSDINYPFNTGHVGTIYFDDYIIHELDNNEREVTVIGYWYIINGEWKKCSSNFKFITNELFVPILIHKPVTFRVVEKGCTE